MIFKAPIYVLLFPMVFTTSLFPSIEPVTAKGFNQVFPTYNMGPEDPCTYFKDLRVEGLHYFRGSRSVYPYTFLNDYKPGKQDIEYEVIRLENEFIYVDIIPQLRGRIQGAVDKRNNWDFLYYNHVIKPAEIAVRSAWISGGLEYNHPGGHGYTQFSKISHEILENEDGSKTVVVAEIEPVRMMKWEYEITLRPGELYFETKGRFFSTEPFPVPFLSSNNAAMHATPEMELIYPQETHASGHGFDNMQKWSDHGPGDSAYDWIKNINRALSAFADGRGLLLDYWGTYSHDEGIDAGTVVVADHRVAPGKKFFTWGTHDSGKQWDHFLSDEDGGYVELQQQAFFTNLGYGYALLDPFEVKEFSIYWYPIMQTGGFVTAARELALNFKRLNNQTVRLDIQPTQTLQDIVIHLYKNDSLEESFEMDLIVGEVYQKKIGIRSTEDDILKLKIVDSNGRELLQYATRIDPIQPVVNRIPGKDVTELSIDQLYARALTDDHDPYGVDADVYLKEILNRDPLESRANRLMGILSIKRGQYEQAIQFLEKSLKNDHFDQCYQTWFLLGFTYIQLGNLDKAHEYLVQSSRRKSELDQSLYYLAQIQLLKGNYHQALYRLKEIPESHLTHPYVHNLIAYTYRKLGNVQMAEKALDKAFAIDPINFVGYVEKLALAKWKGDMISKINSIFDRKERTFIGSQVYIDTAIHYMALDDFEEALNVLSIAEEQLQKSGELYPFVAYYMGYCLLQQGEQAQAIKVFTEASGMDSIYVFPYRTTTLEILESHLSLSPDDPVARMYRGDLLYHLRRHDEAIAEWKISRKLMPDNYRINRNLALSKYVKTGELDETVELMEEAFAQSDDSLRLYSELEQLYYLQKNYLKVERLYDENPDIISRKGDFALNAADFYIGVGRYSDALEKLANTYFSAAESEMGKPLRHTRYVEACIGLGNELLKQKKYQEAIQQYLLGYEYPEYLNEVKVLRPVTTRLDYHIAVAYEKAGQQDLAEKFFLKAMTMETKEASVGTVYKARAMQEMGQEAEAKALVQKMLDSLPAEDPEGGRTIKGLSPYLGSLAHEFLGNRKMANQFREDALESNHNVVMLARYDSASLER